MGILRQKPFLVGSSRMQTNFSVSERKSATSFLKSTQKSWLNSKTKRQQRRLSLERTLLMLSRKVIKLQGEFQSLERIYKSKLLISWDKKTKWRNTAKILKTLKTQVISTVTPMDSVMNKSNVWTPIKRSWVNLRKKFNSKWSPAKTITMKTRLPSPIYLGISKSCLLEK